MNRKITAALLTITLTLGSSGVAIAGTVLDEFLKKHLGTQSVESKSLFRDGNLSGCSLEYNTLIQDYIYKQGGIVNVSGSIGVMKINDGLGVTLKVIVKDLNPKTAKVEPESPEAVYLLSGLKTSKEAYVKSTSGDPPGALLTLFNIEPTLKMLLEGVLKREIAISFRRKGGVSDVPFTIDPTVTAIDDNGNRTHSPAQGVAFTECVMNVIDNSDKPSGKKK